MVWRPVDKERGTYIGNKACRDESIGTIMTQNKMQMGQQIDALVVIVLVLVVMTLCEGLWRPFVVRMMIIVPTLVPNGTEWYSQG